MDLLKEIKLARRELSGVVKPTPLIENFNLSEQFGAAILLKREDQQVVHSFKIRGVYNKINSLNTAEKEIGIVCASDGNHAQAVAYCCELLKIKGRIYMPKNTPKQKLEQVQQLGKNYIRVINAGNSFEEANAIALGDASIHRKSFIHPFNDLKIIAGQGTVGLEVLEECTKPIDYVFVPLEGGGLAAGLSTVFKHLSPNTKIIGVTTQDNPSLEIVYESTNTFNNVDSVVHNVFIKKGSNLNSEICQKNLNAVLKIQERKVCSTMLQLFTSEDINIEPAGVLSIAALDYYADEIKGKNVVCIISGGLKNIEKETEIRERSLLFEGLVHYLIIEFPQRTGVLKVFINEVLGPDDEVTYFQYLKNDNSIIESVLVRLELKNPNNIQAIKANMLRKKIEYQKLNDSDDLFRSNISLINNAFAKELI